MPNSDLNSLYTALFPETCSLPPAGWRLKPAGYIFQPPFSGSTASGHPHPAPLFLFGQEALASSCLHIPASSSRPPAPLIRSSAPEAASLPSFSARSTVAPSPGSAGFWPPPGRKATCRVKFSKVSTRKYRQSPLLVVLADALYKKKLRLHGEKKLSDLLRHFPPAHHGTHVKEGQVSQSPASSQRWRFPSDPSHSCPAPHRFPALFHERLSPKSVSSPGWSPSLPPCSREKSGRCRTDPAYSKSWRCRSAPVCIPLMNSRSSFHCSRSLTIHCCVSGLPQRSRHPLQGGVHALKLLFQLRAGGIFSNSSLRTTAVRMKFFCSFSVVCRLTALPTGRGMPSQKLRTGFPCALGRSEFIPDIC